MTKLNILLLLAVALMRFLRISFQQAKLNFFNKLAATFLFAGSLLVINQEKQQCLK